ncbi:MAG: hypothetical protein KF901_17250 [Myxococcales bacterium]|nr:hypothetical protein [Myxococcales bacterium]
MDDVDADVDEDGDVVDVVDVDGMGTLTEMGMMRMRMRMDGRWIHLSRASAHGGGGHAAPHRRGADGAVTS